MSRSQIRLLLIIVLLSTAVVLTTAQTRVAPATRTHRQVIVPGEDRFFPFAVTIRSGESVQWVNMDTDDHTVVSNDFFNTAGHNATNVLLKGTDSNGGQPGTFTLHFSHPGTFVYYCRFHAHLDDSHQPIAPGPNGGIQDSSGNFGTPMNGIVTVLPTD